MDRMNGYSVKHNNTMLYSTQYDYYGESEYLISDRVSHESISNSVETLFEFDYHYNEMVILIELQIYRQLHCI